MDSQTKEIAALIRVLAQTLDCCPKHVLSLLEGSVIDEEQAGDVREILTALEAL